ncbi:MAG: hypothetical protein D6802_07950 [Ardenticatenia bacterium]|nr:MAG: hypothetical protein D6802_07950 [Ardenticatenia bacterium]
MPPLDPDNPRLVETVHRFTTLGIRFRDATTSGIISDGLSATAWPATATTARRTAFRTSGHALAFRGLPGLASVEYPDGSPAPTPRDYIIEVRDARRRFLPVAMRIALPLPYGGLYRPGGDGTPADFYLFSSPARAPLPAVAIVHATLEDAAHNTPAAWAMLEIAINGETFYGFSHTNGQVLAMFPYPAFTAPPEHGPPVAGTMQTWALTVRVRAASTLPTLPGTPLPDFAAMSTQPFATIETTDGGTPQNSLNATLTFGEPLTLQTAGRSTLRIHT